MISLFKKPVPTIQLQDRGKISVDGSQNGGSGNINLTAREIDLSDDSSISAQVEFGNEGNITLVADNLFLDDRSRMTTNATNDSTGGNIFLNLQDNLLTRRNSQIVSNAVRGRGGNISIQTRGLFTSSNSIIGASSKFGVDGSIIVNTVNAHSASGLIQLPDKPIDPNLYLTAGCGLRNNYSFVNIGRGGLPANPINSIAKGDLLPDLNIANNEFPKLLHSSEVSWQNHLPFPDKPIAEATTWEINQKGNVELAVNSTERQTLNFARGDRNCLKSH